LLNSLKFDFKNVLSFSLQKESTKERLAALTFASRSLGGTCGGHP